MLSVQSSFLLGVESCVECSHCSCWVWKVECAVVVFSFLLGVESCLC